MAFFASVLQPLGNSFFQRIQNAAKLSVTSTPEALDHGEHSSLSTTAAQQKIIHAKTPSTRPALPWPRTPRSTLNSGQAMPVIGLGTWQAPAGQVGAAVKAALEGGYRHIDCAAIYGNEAEIGAVFAEAFSSGLVKRRTSS